MLLFLANEVKFTIFTGRATKMLHGLVPINNAGPTMA